MENFEMPTPCRKCGEIFDLNDGRCSEKWYPDTTICESCWEKEQEEIEVDGFIEDALINIDDALHTLNEHGAMDKISDENRALIIDSVTHRREQLIDFMLWHCRHYPDESLLGGGVEPNHIDEFLKPINCG